MVLQHFTLRPDVEVTVSVFGSVVYNRAIVYKRQIFLKVLVDVIIIEQCNQTAHCMKSG